MKKIICAVISLLMCFAVGCAASGSVSEEDAAKLIRNYYDGLEKDDYDMMMGGYPLFYQNFMAKEISAAGYPSVKAYMDETSDYFIKVYGADFTIKFTISDFKKLTTTQRNERTNAIASTFGISNPNLEEAYSFMCHETSSGSVSTENHDTEYYVLVIDGKAYLYDLLYEEAKAAQDKS